MLYYCKFTHMNGSWKAYDIFLTKTLTVTTHDSYTTYILEPTYIHIHNHYTHARAHTYTKMTPDTMLLVLILHLLITDQWEHRKITGLVWKNRLDWKIQWNSLNMFSKIHYFETFNKIHECFSNNIFYPYFILICLFYSPFTHISILYVKKFNENLKHSVNSVKYRTRLLFSCSMNFQ